MDTDHAATLAGPKWKFVACQRDGTSGLPRPRDHRVWSVIMVVSVLLVN
jgi:hypothetical protein